MDAAGARALRARIEQHEHWRRAEAVRSGHQSARDPDVGSLVECRGDVRIYEDPSRRFVKRLVGGFWRTLAEAAP